MNRRQILRSGIAAVALGFAPGEIRGHGPDDELYDIGFAMLRTMETPAQYQAFMTFMLAYHEYDGPGRWIDYEDGVKIYHDERSWGFRLMRQLRPHGKLDRLAEGEATRELFRQWGMKYKRYIL